MSRSYKKTPICTCGGNLGGTRKYWKRQANKRLRKSKVTGKKSNYKKVYESWNIRDYHFYKQKNCNMDEEDVKWWEKHYHRK